MDRVIVHLDADSFFASVEQASDARLRDKPVAVGGTQRGVISSASYEARKYGICAAMPTVRARRLCPKLIVVPGDFEKYERFSQWMFSYPHEFTPNVEISSIDEGYFDLSGTRKPPLEIAETIRRAIQQKLKIVVSEGIASNKLVSQIASKLNKPAAFHQVAQGQEIPFLHPLPNHWLPGIGPTAARKLNAAGLARIGQIADTPLDLLQVVMGNSAKTLKEYSNGIDERPLIGESAPAKSYSRQETFEKDQTDEMFLETTLKGMADDLMATIRQEGKSIRTLTVKIRYNDMAEDQAGESLNEPTDLETDIYSRIRILFKQAWRRRVSLRMVSLRLSNVYDGVVRSELALERAMMQYESRRRLACAVDDLRERKGKTVIFRGHDLALRWSNKTKPVQVLPSVPAPLPKRQAVRSYLPLNIHSYYSFLNSTLSPEAVVSLAAQHDLPAIALTDDGNLHGAVNFAIAARKAGVKPIFGARVKIGGIPVLLYVENATGYRNLCRLLSEPKELTIKECAPRTDGLIAVSYNRLLAPYFPGRFYFAVNTRKALQDMPSQWPCVAAPSCRYAVPADRWKYDILQSIRTLTLLKQEHPEKVMNGLLHFRTANEMGELFGAFPSLLSNSNEIAQRCSFEFPFGKPQFPSFATPDGSPPQAFLRKLVFEGLKERYGARAASLQNQIEEELAIISKVGYEEYFLVVWDILQECRRLGIDWITRGSAADSLVCYCLFISGVCPIRFDLYFKRFLNLDRMALNKLPDIDIDFPHDRKDDVIDFLLRKYGPDHAAVVGGFSTYQARGAVGDVAKVLGVSEFQIRRFTEKMPHTSATGLADIMKQSQECGDLPLNEEPYKTALIMAEFLDGFPRNRKMHPCGVVLSRQPVHDLTPTFAANKGYKTTHYDMDGVEDIGLIKIDVLAQGGLAVMRDTKNSLAKRGIAVDLEALEPWEDPAVWEMIAGGGGRAVHHIESPAMITLCRMTNVREIHGLIAIVSVIRPGAANETKKISFTRRYQGLEPTIYPHPSLEACLKSTYGLIVYEEHILQICEAFAGLPPGRADVLRRGLVKRKADIVAEIAVEFRTAALLRGHPENKIAEVWEAVTGFDGYAFNKAHSTAYGVEAYQSAFLKLNYPVEFMAGVLTNGKGFYDPLVYVLESLRLGIQLLPPSVNELGPEFVPREKTIRLPVRYIKGMTDRTGQKLLDEFDKRPFESLKDLFCRVSPSSEEMDIMLRAGAFDCFEKKRTALFWEAQFIQRAFGGVKNPDQGMLLPPSDLDRMPTTPLQEPTMQERLRWEAELFGFPVSGHPLDLHPSIAWDTYCKIGELEKHIGKQVVVCGLVIEQRLFSQSDGETMKFLTIADWSGIVETELFAKTYRNYGLATVRYPVLEIVGTVEPYENGRGHSLRVQKASKPRLR